MSEQDYRRGQIFGFTIAEAVLLLFFALLLLLASALVAKEREISEYSVEQNLRKQIMVALERYEDDPKKFFVVIEDFKKDAKRELEKITDDSVKYEEYRQFLLVLANEAGMGGDERLLIKKMISLINAGEKLRGTHGENLSKEAIDEVFRWYVNLTKDGLKDDPEAFKKKFEEFASRQADYEKKLDQLKKERNYLKSELAALGPKGAKAGFGLPPCWIDDNNKPINSFVVTMVPEGFILNSSAESSKNPQQKFYKELMEDEFMWGKVTPEDTFRGVVRRYRELGVSDKDNECQFWAGVVDCLPNDKTLYKSRMSVLSNGFRLSLARAESACALQVPLS